MAIISCGQINKNLIPVVVGCVVSFLNRILNQYDGTKLFENPILTNIYISFSIFLTVIPFIILKFRTKPIKSTEIINNNTKTKIEYICNKVEDDIIEGKFKCILISAIIYFYSMKFVL